MQRGTVLIIGAGPSGLAAARMLHDQEYDVTVVEARDRIGGRIYTDRTIADHPIEFGAEFIHGDATITWELIRAMNEKTIFVGSYPDFLYEHDGKIFTYEELCSAVKGMDRVFALEHEMRSFQENAPDVSLETWLSTLPLEEKAAAIFARFLSHVYLTEANDLSAAEVVREEMIHHAGDDDYRIAGGYDHVMEFLARDIKIRLSSPVVVLDDDGSTIRATLQDGTIFEADYCIVTVPLSLLQQKTITFHPPLPAWKENAIQGLRMGSVMKVPLVFSECCWDRSKTLYVGEKDVFIWELPSRERKTKTPTATAFITGRAAEKLDALEDDELYQVCLNEFCRMLGSKRPKEVFLRGARSNWLQDPWSRGGYSSVPPGSFGLREELAKPIGHLHFAGEATVYESNPATVHGAMESGRRAAQAIMRDEH